MTDESINKKTSEDSLEYASEITEEVPSVKDFYQNLSGKYVYCPENSDGKQARSRKGALTFAIIMSAAFILSLGALLLVLLLPPKPQASAIISYNELYEKCAPFSVSIETADGSIGSGFFITEGGRIVTNYHVVGTSKTVTVHTYEGKTYAAQVSAYDKTNDIAIVDVITTGNETFSYAEFADSSTVKTGDPVMVIGSPEKISLGWTMTVGYVSSADRKESSDKNARSFIQFDAAVNPGNSGGALINTKGELIGITSSKYVGSGIENMAFAIPIDTVEYALAQFEAFGGIARPDFGISLEQSWEAKIGLPTNKGLTVKTAPEGALAKGDVIYEVNGIKVSSTADWNEAIKATYYGEPLKIKYKAGGEKGTASETTLAAVEK